MQPSIFNVRVPLASGDTFLMNTFSDGQVIVTPEITSVLDRLSEPRPGREFSDEEQSALSELAEHGFIVADRASERRALDEFFHDFREDTRQLRVTVLTTLQCNFACDYCFQGDHGDYNKFAHKMSLETAGRVVAWGEERLEDRKSVV